MERTPETVALMLRVADEIEQDAWISKGKRFSVLAPGVSGA